VKEIGGSIVGVALLIELVALKGRARLEGENVHVVLDY
jgi:adenine/guanine phosphoribosyltransferase-like PRPP-binding protein